MHVKRAVQRSAKDEHKSLSLSVSILSSDTRVFLVTHELWSQSSLCPILAITFSVLMSGSRDLIIAVTARLVQILRSRVSTGRKNIFY